LNLAQVFEREKNESACDDMFNKALKKYKYSKKVWMAYQQYKLKQGKTSDAKELLNRSMQSLAKHKHIEVIMKYALTEYDIGAYDRGRYLFEELLCNYVKRSDVWHIYVDREIKLGQLAYARQLF
jgi:rRNA biogenesis protein RRP5